MYVHLLDSNSHLVRLHIFEPAPNGVFTHSDANSNFRSELPHFDKDEMPCALCS